tara:strand:- start:204 stop:446 length:243 start_codon:yes stop_codon:yes gene_type:complete
MNKYTCTATIKYTRQEVQLHINALKIALNNPQLTSYRGRYETLLQDMTKIDKQMYEAETDAMLNQESGEELVEGTVVQNA